MYAAGGRHSINVAIWTEHDIPGRGAIVAVLLGAKSIEGGQHSFWSDSENRAAALILASGVIHSARSCSPVKVSIWTLNERSGGLGTIGLIETHQASEGLCARSDGAGDAKQGDSACDPGESELLHGWFLLAWRRVKTA